MSVTNLSLVRQEPVSLNQVVPDYAHGYLEVDLGAIAFNYRALSSMLKPGTKTAAVVKGNAYGLGAEAVAQKLYSVGCREFFYAYLEEGMKGRQALPHPDATIYVLSGVFQGCESYFAQYNLIPALISLEQVYRWVDEAKRVGKSLPCLIHFDTGMGREGLSYQEFLKFLEHKEGLMPHLDIRYIMSHLANSNETQDPKNQLQLTRFLEIYKHFPGVKASFSNSSGINLGPAFHFDLVRPGVALYGYKSAFGEFVPLKPSVKAYARVLLTRSLPKGESIGYQGIFTCERDTRLALVSVGHCDGVMRIGSNQNMIKINGLPARVVGRVSMDVFMADITDHPEGSVVAGQWATLYDDTASARTFADNQQTSIYEVLVRHGQRFFRTYKDQTE